MRRRIILAIVLLIVLGRSLLFLLAPESYFDSDQAIVGLMAKHLSEGRAFPVFLYGQTYMLGVEAWLAAPLFFVFGASITALKLPLLAMNLVVALLLVTTFEREMGLRTEFAALAALPFVLPSVGLSAVLMDSSGGSLEPFLYIVLLWVTRRRPIVCGLVLGIGFLNREFTIYGLAALACIDVLERVSRSEAGGRRSERIKRWAAIIGVAAAVWISVQGLKQFSSGAGPGTTIADTFTASNNLAELAGRTCFSPAKAIGGARNLFTVHWPAILGTGRYPLAAFSIESRRGQGTEGSSWLPAAAVLIAIAGILIGARRRGSAPPPRFAQYLVLSAAFSITGYLFGRCGEVNFYSMRYELLSLLGIAGLSAWFLSTPVSLSVRVLWGAAFAAWMWVAALPHALVADEYLNDRPVPAKRALIDELAAQGVRYGRADYWLAYYIDFVTNERLIFASDPPQRILLYNAIVDAHANEAVRLSRRRCDGGTAIIPGVYKCP